MRGDFSRSTWRASNHYSSVRLQQGRVLLDAEWNEQVDIAGHVQRTTTADVVGLHGAPKSPDEPFANFAGRAVRRRRGSADRARADLRRRHPLRERRARRGALHRPARPPRPGLARSGQLRGVPRRVGAAHHRRRPARRRLPVAARAGAARTGHGDSDARRVAGATRADRRPRVRPVRATGGQHRPDAGRRGTGAGPHRRLPRAARWRLPAPGEPAVPRGGPHASRAPGRCSSGRATTRRWPRARLPSTRRR